MITKAERGELRSLVRQRFKLLRSEVAQRQSELLADLETAVTARFADEDQRWADASFKIAEAAREANRTANDIIREFIPEWREREVVGCAQLGKPNTQQRQQLRREGQARIEAQVRAALLQLQQQEADLLTRLALGVLESAEGRAFLGEIPTVSALVPAVRLLELEQSLGRTD